MAIVGTAFPAANHGGGCCGCFGTSSEAAEAFALTGCGWEAFNDASCNCSWCFFANAKSFLATLRASTAFSRALFAFAAAAAASSEAAAALIKRLPSTTALAAAVSRKGSNSGAGSAELPAPDDELALAAFFGGGSAELPAPDDLAMAAFFSA